MGVSYAEVIGDPIAHSKSPLIHKFWLEKLGLSYDFRKTRVLGSELGTYLHTRLSDPDWCGCNVTIPHKQAVIRHLDTTAADAGRLGAVNTVVRQGAGQAKLAGYNTDWSGFLEPLRPWLVSLPTYSFAHVIGTGGAAAAVCYALDRRGFTVVNIVRDRKKALTMRQRLELFDDDLIVDLEAMGHRTEAKEWGANRLDILVNATPLGMTGFAPLKVNLENLPSNLVVYDLVYDPVETPLLRDARSKGMPIIDGLSMLIGQAARAFELFFVAEAPREHDLELRELLIR